VHQVQRILHDADRDGSGQHTDRGSASAEDANAADHDSGDGGEGEGRASLGIAVSGLDAIGARADEAPGSEDWYVFGRLADKLGRKKVYGYEVLVLAAGAIASACAPGIWWLIAFRGILDGRSSTVWSGMIKVDPGAQQIDAFQESRNLLLSKTAHADSVPGLEILANDVRCTHAATVSRVDSELLFFLMARGFERREAEQMLVTAFYADWRRLALDLGKLASSSSPIRIVTTLPDWAR